MSAQRSSAKLLECLKRTDIKSIVIVGAGPIVIGQACEFDYSGTQACKALKEEGYRVILVNSNPATIMTDPGLADATYVEPITPEIVAKIFERERPDALLPTMGGQTGLNTALDLWHDGVLERLGVELIGAKADVIAKAEDRQLFREAMESIGLECPRSRLIHDMDDAQTAIEEIGLPCYSAAVFYARWHRRWHRVQPGRLFRDRGERPAGLADLGSPR